MSQGALEIVKSYCLRAVPVDKAVFDGQSFVPELATGLTVHYAMLKKCKSILGLGLVKVIFVNDKGLREEIAEQTGERCLAAGGAAADGDDDGALWGV